MSEEKAKVYGQCDGLFIRFKSSNNGTVFSLKIGDDRKSFVGSIGSDQLTLTLSGTRLALGDTDTNKPYAKLLVSPTIEGKPPFWVAAFALGFNLATCAPPSPLSVDHPYVMF